MVMFPVALKVVNDVPGSGLALLDKLHLPLASLGKVAAKVTANFPCPEAPLYGPVPLPVTVKVPFPAKTTRQVVLLMLLGLLRLEGLV